MRSASASLALAACLVGAACTATSPRPLPPRRVAFGPGPGPSLQGAPDLPLPTRPPQRSERYLGWTLAADALSIGPLTMWMYRPEDTYLMAPALFLAPIIHVAHGETGHAVGSLAMRLAMVGGVYLAGRSAREECSDPQQWICLPMQSIVLADLAIIPVVVFDSLLLARRNRDDQGWYRLPIVPSVSAGPGGGVSLSVGSQF